MDNSEDADFVASEHDRLISAISKLDKTQHITEPTRSEPSLLNSEFNLIKRSNKLDLNKVAKVLTDTANHVKIGKKLKKTQDENRVLSKPLDRPQAERVKRATGYEQTKKQVGRWDPVVARSRGSDYVSFPLKHAGHKLQPTSEFLSKLKLKSELERELEELDPPAEIEDEDDEEQVYPMSYEEMVEQRQHLAKMRAQQSYTAAKAKRQSKIKSKKYHRILKKERLKQQLKEFEELQKTNPEEALKKLEALEKTRALERHTLRHKNTGKWARNKMVRAKYDKEVRNQLAEQLAVGRSLTQKTQDVDSSDDEGDDGQIIPDIALAQDPMNPWMMSEKDKSNINTEFDFGYKKYLKDRIVKKMDNSDSDSGESTTNQRDAQTTNDLAVLKKSINRLSKDNNDNIYETANKQETLDKSEVINEDLDDTTKNDHKATTTKQLKINNRILKSKINKKEFKKAKCKVNEAVATSSWTVENIEDKASNKQTPDVFSIFETLENKAANKVEKKLKRLRQDIAQLEMLTKETTTKNKKQKTDEPNADDTLEYLKLKNKKTKVVVDEALIETSSNQADSTINIGHKKLENIVATINTTTQEISKSKPANSDNNIDPTRFIEVKPKFLNSVIADGETGLDQLDDHEQVVPRVNIEEVFEEDDVVAGFRQEKEDEINKDKEEDINLTLPGWGTWGGKGVIVKTPKRKRNRFIQKPAPVMPRRDENKGDIIIKEYKDPKLQVHKVKELPYPFKSVKDYEATIRAPLSNTFIPEKPFKKLIRPSVITKAGTIIDPMDEEELLLPKNRKFGNTDIIKITSMK
ncbi:hypothetical protein K1T71_009662 [Dendrolimus kikuchii]|uniref:Uncharacterized protein n=1 Tax=Dendrolimus kikuchii TaxID=765133 RepID=A0ACC1CS97_9NEOP|nr:hypothetical protein K1T71_009662 [Dendrolimus kikuchii]